MTDATQHEGVRLVPLDPRREARELVRDRERFDPRALRLVGAREGGAVGVIGVRGSDARARDLGDDQPMA